MINPFRSRQHFWWIITTVEPTHLIGPFRALEAANTIGYGKLDVPFEVLELTTSDRSKASQIVKEIKLERGKGLAEATQRIKHGP